ncbi:unnamed protein product, partial [Aphis gossypii]
IAISLCHLPCFLICLRSWKYDVLGRPLNLFYKVFPSKIFFINVLCLNRCPIHFVFVFNMCFIIFLFSLSSFNTCSFVFLSTHDVWFIFLQIHISIASKRSFSFFLIVQVSHPYTITHSIQMF